MPVTLIPDRLPAFTPHMVPDPGVASPPRPAPDLLDVAEVVAGAADPVAALEDACRAHPALAEHLRVMFAPDVATDVRTPDLALADTRVMVHLEPERPRYTLDEPAPEETPFARRSRLSVPPTPEAAAAAPLAPGALCGPFQLVRPLGHGATAQVWEAIDRRYDAPVALKLFSAEASRSAELDRAMAEASAMSRITHDNVVFVREAGRIGGTGSWFIAMALYREPVEGEAEPQVAQDLAKVAPRSTAEVVGWGVQIARALAAAHAAGVFHQDLKPENVLCLPASRTVRLGDFGLAPLAQAGVGNRRSQRWSQPGLYCAGTPELMAPEQARGLDHTPDPQHDRAWLTGVDIYGLGATLWTLLADEAPHAPPASNQHADVVAACTEPVARVDRVPTRFPVPARLARVIEKAMADDPDDRYASAEAFADDLQRWLDRRPLSVDAPMAPVRAKLWVQRHPLRAQTVAMGLLALVGLQGFWSLGARIEAKQEELSAAESRLGDLDAALATTNAELDAARTQANAIQGALQSTQAELGVKTETIAALSERFQASQATLTTAVEDARAGAQSERLRGDVAEAGQRATAEVLQAALDNAAVEGRRASREALRADLAEADKVAALARVTATEARIAELDAQVKAAKAEAQRAQAAQHAAELARREAEAASAALAEESEPADVRIRPRGE